MAHAGIAFCRNDDLAELFTCFEKWYAFNPRMRERDYFAWQFRGPVRLADAEYDFLVLRGADGKIAGCLGFSGFEFQLHGAIHTGGWTHSWYAANQREAGLGLLSKFMELVDNRFYLRLNENSARVFRLLRVPLLLRMPRWWAVTDAELATDMFSIFAPDDRAILRRSAGMLARLAAAPSMQFVTRFESDCEFDFEQHPDIVGYVRRSARYLNWRYVDIPRHHHRIIRSERAFAVYRIETIMETEVSAIRILEWTFDADETPAALATMMADARAYKPVLFDFHCTALSIGRLLEPFGFVQQTSTQSSMPDLFRPTFHSGGYAVGIDFPPHRTLRDVDFTRWYITIGDSDIDRVKL